MTRQEPHTQEAEETAAETKKDRKAENRELIKTLVLAILLATVIRSLFYEPFHIPSGSMKGNLLIGDYLFVSKFSYGYSRYSFPFGLPLFEGRIFADPPERGDIAVFRLPTMPSIDYIKRVIGLPGDRIQVKQGVLYINDQEIPRKRVEDFEERLPDGSVKRMTQYVETLPNGVSYRVLDATPRGNVDNTGVYTVPEDHYFMMGDNRDNSQDSRYLDKVGYVPFENLVGRAEIIVFSFDDKEDAPFWQLWSWFDDFRTDRFFTPLNP